MENPTPTTSESPLICRNCSAVLTGPFCHRCGQASRTYIAPLSGLGKEVAADVLAYDSRVWRTLKALLLKPGLLSLQYVQGKRARYTPPTRLYLITSILAFLMVALLISSTDLALEMTDGFTEGFNAEPRTAIEINGADWHPEDNPVELRWLSAAGNAWLNRQVAVIDANASELISNPGRVMRSAASLLPQTMFVILPLFSAWVGVFYLLSKRYYIEHLLLQVHNHAFLFLSLVVLYLITLIRSPLATASFFGHGVLDSVLLWTGTAIWLWLPVYVLLSMKRFYGQGWAMTLTKGVLLGLSYLLMLIMALGVVMILGIWRL